MTRTNKTTAHTSQVYDLARQNFICLLRLTISKDSEGDSESNDSRTPRAGLRTSSVDREGIMNHIRSHTRRAEFSRGAVEGFLDFAQAIDLVLKSITYKEPSVSDVSESPTFSATPEIKLMSWKEWDDFDVAIPTSRPHCAIDVLIDEYHGHVGSNSISLLQPGIHNEATARERGQHLNAGQDPLPTRIRINSGPAKRILGPILDARDDWRWRNAAPVLVRPFKVLAAHSMEINDKMTEIERILAEKRKEQEVSEIVADEGPQPGNNSEDTPDHDEGPRQEDDDACPIIEHANGEDISKVEAQSSRRTSFSRDMHHDTGTDDLAECDLSIVEEAARDFRCVVEFANETLQPVRSYLQSEPSSVNFNNIWYLFPTGSLVYIKDRSMPRKIWKVIQATGGRRYLREPRTEIPDWQTKWSPFVIDCYYLDFDGTNLVRVYHQFTIEMFDGSMPIDGLQIMPLTVAERLLSGINREEFRKQGEQFLTYLTPQFRYYQGTTLTQSPRGDPLFTQEEGKSDSHRLFTERVESQVVVDLERGIQANPDWAPPSTEIDLWNSDSAEFEEDHRQEDLERDRIWDSRASEDFLKNEEAKRQRWNTSDEMPEGDDLLLLPDRVFSFVLRTRSWGRSTTSTLREEIMS
jgi:hypothetical protein